MTKELTQSIAKEFFDYDPKTGILIHKERDIKWFNKPKDHRSAQWACNVWNAKYAGKEVANISRKNGYKTVSVFRKSYPAHRFIWFWQYGEMPVNQIDHKNHIRDDNRLINLEQVTHSQNGRNQSKGKNNLSGITGVSFWKERQKWISQIMINRQKIHLGIDVCFGKMIKARKEAEKRYGFHPNHGK